MRTLATRLVVYPTAIYWYVPNRKELFARVAKLVLADIRLIAKPIQLSRQTCPCSNRAFILRWQSGAEAPLDDSLAISSKS